MKSSQAKRSPQKAPGTRPTTVLSSALFLLIVSALVAFAHVSKWQNHSKTYVGIVSEQGVLSQRIAKHALEAAAGKETAFPLLENSRNRFDQLLQTLKQGDPARGLPASPAETRDALRHTENSWMHLREKADRILDSKESILAVERFVNGVNQLIPRLQERSDEVVQVLVKSNAKPKQILIASRQLMLSQRMENNVGKALAGGQVSAAAIDQFGRDATRFGRVLVGMLEGDKSFGVQRVTNPEAMAKLAEVTDLFGLINSQAKKIITTTLNVLPALQGADELTMVSDNLNESTSALADLYRSTPGLMRVGNVVAGSWLILGLGAAAVAALVLLGFQLLLAGKRRASSSEAQNQRNQQAIMRLLDQMETLADGDLTVEATVTNDITGAIADSTNYTVAALRQLVATINEAASQVSDSAHSTRATATHMAEASMHQAEQITSAGNAIDSMAAAMDQMAASATESANVSQHSVSIAAKGAATVRSTIQGMDEIREQIQETAKRIKRLGESSQQIGDIVELIDDIADQTNILALNAAMQAAMAGEAGRGFAVVADEVQRLAERSGDATRQIEALVKTIQADTKEAVISMEQSTAGVVRGAKLAEDAGEALAEIDSVSNRISTLTSRISELAQYQSGEASQISGTMKAIQEITTQTSTSTNKTADSIGDLVNLAEALQHSVSGFKLPNKAAAQG